MCVSISASGSSQMILLILFRSGIRRPFDDPIRMISQELSNQGSILAK